MGMGTNMQYSPLTKALIDALATLPSIGSKSAQRLAFHLLAQESRQKGLALANAIDEAMKSISLCEQCRVFCEDVLCPICMSDKRDQRIVCVVESPADLVAIEQSQHFRGLYFVLHGRISPLDGVGPEECGMPDLFALIKKHTIHEVIIATSATMEGEATAHYITHQCRTLHGNDITLTRIAQGVPIGGELEYLDNGTLRLALSSRTPIEETTTT
jgi:recombination protein RecR